MDDNIPYNAQAVIQTLADQIAALTRDNAVLLSALRVEQHSHQQTQALLRSLQEVPAPAVPVGYSETE